MARDGRATPPDDLLKKMYFEMCVIRYFEEQVQYLFLTEDMPGTIHSSIGQEAIAVGVCACLRREDYLCGSHRGHGQYIAKGGEARRLMAELFAKDSGCCRGMGGSVHLAGFEDGYLPGVGVVGANIPIAAGAALSSKMRGTDQVTVCIFGDGASNTGYFHEGINLAAIWYLPVVFVCENNLYGVSTRIGDAMRAESIASRASAYGIHGLIVDGNDVVEVYEATREAVVNARQGRGPALLELRTYRQKGHSRFEPGAYRPPEEVEAWLARDPVPRLRSMLIELGIFTHDEVDAIENRAHAVIEDAVRFARSSADPSPNAGEGFVYA